MNKARDNPRKDTDKDKEIQLLNGVSGCIR